MAKGLVTIVVLVAVSLCVGMTGYRVTEHMIWIDAFYNASMILSGMGPAAELQSYEGKLFAGCYAIYSGLFLIAAMGILLAPVFHRVLHGFHYKR